MKFLYYIVPIDGDVVGTNDIEIAGEYAKDEDFVVISTLGGSVLRVSNEDGVDLEDIKEVSKELWEGDDEDE